MSAEEKVDHAAEAVRVMGLAHDNQNSKYYELAGVQLQRAQIHATLALAEQTKRVADAQEAQGRPLTDIATYIGLVFNEGYPISVKGS